MKEEYDPNCNYRYLFFNSDLRINIKISKEYIEYKIYIYNKEQNYSYIKFDSIDTDLLAFKLIEEVSVFIKENNIKIGLDPYWKYYVKTGVKDLTFPK